MKPQSVRNKQSLKGYIARLVCQLIVQLMQRQCKCTDRTNKLDLSPILIIRVFFRFPFINSYCGRNGGDVEDNKRIIEFRCRIKAEKLTLIKIYIPNDK